MSELREWLGDIDAISSGFFDVYEIVKRCYEHTDVPTEVYLDEEDDEGEIQIHQRKARDFLEGIEYIRLVDKCREMQEILAELEQDLLKAHREVWGRGLI